MPDASKPIQKGVPPHLVAYPSLSTSLSTLPQAKNLAHVAVYTSSMSGQHAAESEAKVCSGLIPLTIWTMLISPTLLASKGITKKCWVGAIARLRELPIICPHPEPTFTTAHDEKKTGSTITTHLMVTNTP
ncbi:hypothetical protein V8E53_012012 [Lactarius tabidus]